MGRRETVNRRCWLVGMICQFTISVYYLLLYIITSYQRAGNVIRVSLYKTGSSPQGEISVLILWLWPLVNIKMIKQTINDYQPSGIRCLRFRPLGFVHLLQKCCSFCHGLLNSWQKHCGFEAILDFYFIFFNKK